MVVAVNKSRKRNSGNKTPEKSHHSLTVIVTVSVILFFFMARDMAMVIQNAETAGS